VWSFHIVAQDDAVGYCAVAVTYAAGVQARGVADNSAVDNITVAREHSTPGKSRCVVIDQAVADGSMAAAQTATISVDG
jgi:hypothetical protein